MSKIAYENKSQVSAYDAAKWNADDANEIKTSVNALYDSGEGIYLTYKATLTQTGTDAPVATIQFNSLGYVPLLNQGATGISQILLEATGSIDVAKVDVRIGNKTFSAKHLSSTYYFSGAENKTLNIKTRNLITDAYESDMLIDTPIEIRVYS